MRPCRESSQCDVLRRVWSLPGQRHGRSRGGECRHSRTSAADRRCAGEWARCAPDATIRGGGKGSNPKPGGAVAATTATPAASRDGSAATPGRDTSAATATAPGRDSTAPAATTTRCAVRTGDPAGDDSPDCRGRSAASNTDLRGANF
jgi:hypothetical protein